MQTVKVVGTKRTKLSKKALKDARNQGLVICNLYNSDENLHFTTSKLEVRDLVYTPKFNLADITIEDKFYQAIVKDVQFHPITDEVLHIDFLPLIPEHELIAQVPVSLEGIAPGVKQGGKLQRLMRRVTIKTTPEQLVDSVSADVSKLQLGKSIRVRDITPIDGVQIMNAGVTPVAIVEIPRALKSAQSAVTEEEA